ncbi:MAG: alanyl-tRNA editing protein [Halobacteriales archaeon]
MTDRLYFEDSYVDTFEATVEAVDGDAVVLDRTAFYPTGGGQPNDTGWLRTDDTAVAVTDVSGRERIEHVVEDAGRFEVDDHISGHLDWDRRYALMQYHTAQHLLSAVLLDLYDARTTGNQLYPDRARIDCGYPRFDTAQLRDIEEAVNGLIEADLPVTATAFARSELEARLDPHRTRVDLLPASVDPVRIVVIGPTDDPIDRTACGGTHVRTTAEVPRMEITGRETKGGDEERLRFQLSGAGRPP